MAFTSKSKLQDAIRNSFKQVLNDVVEEMWLENSKAVAQAVYAAYSPTSYTRTHEFNSAWSYKVESGAALVWATFYYDPSKMTADSPQVESGTANTSSMRAELGLEGYGQHYSIVTGEDAREYLADIIYEGAKNPGAWNALTKSHKRNAWKILDQAFGAHKIKALIEQGMQKQGMSYKFHSYPQKNKGSSNYGSVGRSNW